MALLGLFRYFRPYKWSYTLMLYLKPLGLTPPLYHSLFFFLVDETRLEECG